MIPATAKLERLGNGTTLHPTYNTNPGNQDMINLQNFYDLTMDLKEAGGCGPAEFPQL